MQKITKDEFFLISDRPDLIVKTNDRKEIIFDEEGYIVEHDSIYGNGESKLKVGRETTYEHFEGSISINDVDEIRIDKFDVSATIVLCATIFGIMAAIYASFLSGLNEIGKQSNSK
jgi:hypothetical protein